MLISAFLIGTLKIELISKNIFQKTQNKFNQEMIDIISIGSYEDIMNIQNSLIIEEEIIYNNIKILKISLKTNNNSHFSRYRMFDER